MDEEKALTWEGLAALYNQTPSIRPAFTLPMDTVFEWAAKQTDRFYVAEDGTLHEVKHDDPR